MNAQNHENKRRLTAHDIVADIRNKLGSVQTVLDLIRKCNIKAPPNLANIWDTVVKQAQESIEEIKDDTYLNKFEWEVERHEIDLEVLEKIVEGQGMILSDSLINVVHKSLNAFKRL